MAHIPNQAREIYKLAVGMFGAAPGTFYFNEINQGLENGLSLVQYYNLLLNEPSFQTSFGLTPASSNEQFVDAFLDRLLGPGTTNVTQAGRDFAEAQLLARLNANVSRGEVMKIAIDALDAVNQSDPNFAAAAQRLDNAIEVAQTFTEDQNGTSQDVNFLRSRLSLVTSDPASVDAQNQANLATGTNFQLTVNEDSGLAFTGGAGNDLFSAPVINVGGTLTDTLQNIDSLDGGGGTNTLDATLNDGGTTTPALANIQNVALRFANAATLDLAGATTPVNQITVQNSTAVGTVTTIGDAGTLIVRNQNQNVNFDGSEASALNLTVENVGSSATAQKNIDLGAVTAAEATSLNLTLNNANIDLISTGGQGVIEDMTIAATGSSTVDLADAAGSVKNLTITGAGGVDLDAVTLAELTDLVADTATGAIKVKVDDSATDVKTGSGADLVTYTAAIGATADINLGAGNDTLTIAAASADGAAVEGGGGTDKLASKDGAFIDADAAAIYTGFETLEVGGGTGDYDLSNLPTVTAVTIGAALAAATNIKEAEAGTTLTVNSKASTDLALGFDLSFALANAAGGSDALTVTLNGKDGDNDGVAEGNITFTKLTANGIENLTVASNITVIDDTLENTDYTHTFTSLDADDLEVLTVTGNANLKVTALTGTALKEVNAGASTGGVTLDASTQAQSVLFVGGSGADDYTGSAEGDTIHTVLGADLVDISAAAAKIDTFIFGANDSLLNEDADGHDVITGFGTAAGGGALDVIDLGAFAFAGQQSSALASKGALDASAVDGSTLTQDDFFMSGVARGVAIGTNGGDTFVFVDVNKDADFDASADLFFQLVGVTDVTLANFGF